MWPNNEFWVDLPKTNLGLAKSHLQRKTHGYAQKIAPDSYYLLYADFFFVFSKEGFLSLPEKQRDYNKN